MALVKLTDRPLPQPPAAPTSQASLLTVKQTADFLRVSKGWLDKSRLTGDGPPYIKVGRRVVYDSRDLQVFLVERKRRHTSEDN